MNKLFKLACMVIITSGSLHAMESEQSNVDWFSLPLAVQNKIHEHILWDEIAARSRDFGQSFDGECAWGFDRTKYFIGSKTVQTVNLKEVETVCIEKRFNAPDESLLKVYFDKRLICKYGENAMENKHE
jgi:hypothetical protein